MIRQLNFSGRIRIPTRCVSIRLRGDGPTRGYDAELDLGDLELPPDAKVIVEAYHRWATRRFEHGTVARPVTPTDRTIGDLPVPRPLFRVKVTQPSGDGIVRIVAAADRVVPVDAEPAGDQRRSLLPVHYEDLGQRVWELRIDEGDLPRLVLNERYLEDGVRELARSHPGFRALVFPEVLRRILTEAVADHDPDADDEEWGTLWLRFACRELGQPRPPDDPTDHADWVAAAVDAFCARAGVGRAVSELSGSDR